MRVLFYSLILLSFFASPIKVNAQQPYRIPGFYDSVKTTMDSSSRLYIKAIHVTGNKKTKTYIILRELLIHPGDSVIAGNIFEILKQSRELVYNTTLFSEVVLLPYFSSPNELEIIVSVKEKWYIYPTPQFQLTDRNFNEWVKVYNADFDRVNYGVKFEHYNFSGRRDILKILLLTGHSRNFSLIYIAPYSNSALTEGFGVNASFSQKREISYRTSTNNKTVQYKSEDFISTNIFTSGSYINRKGHYKKHVYTFGYFHYNMNDSFIKANPGYYNSTNSKRGFPEFSYNYQITRVNNVAYPLEGKLYGFMVTKRGLGWKGGGINMLTTNLYYFRYIPLGREWYNSVQIASRLKIPFDQPYINRQAMGYNDYYMRGYEYYVIDGVASSIAKYTLKKKILSFIIPLPFNSKAFPNIPFAFYGKAYADGGFSYIKEQYDAKLNNRFLYTGGIGLDMLTLYDINFRMEYSFNQLGETGLFLHLSGGF